MKKNLIVAFFLLITRLSYGQQDAQFSQYMFNGIYVNPAYAGYKETVNAQTFYRNQWTGVSGSPKTFSLAIDAITKNDNVGLALQVSADKLGAQQNLAAYANYAYRLRLHNDGNSRLALGLGFGMIQLGLNNNLLKPNEIEVNQPTGSQNVILPDARAGIYFSNERFYAGFSIDNLISRFINVQRYAYIPQPRMHYYLSAGTVFSLSSDILLKPSFLLKDDRGGPTSLDATAFVIFSSKFWVGGSYRTAVKLYSKPHLQSNLSSLNSAVGAIQFFPNEKIRVGYAYDYALGRMGAYLGGTHEISVGYTINNKRVRITSPRYF